MQIKQNVKTDIEAAIKAFHTGNLTDNALGFFRTLGYNTERQQPFNQKTYNYFKEYYAHESDNKFNEEKAQVKNWKYIDLLFQLSHEELSGQCSVFKKEVITKDDGSKIDIESYLFFVIELKKENYTRTALSQINREINKVFSMPVMVLFKYGKTLTLSVIDRRLNKRDEQKDVLKKVTLIKDISIEKPHRAHIEIFFDLSFEEIKNKYKFSNFVELHNAWRKTLNIKELNNKFYNELFKWYLWAGQNVKFPQIRPDVDKIPDETHQNESIIRLLTRLLFCWFMKEKQTLIPEILFKQSEIEKILKGFSMEETNNSVYYRAILQNLFFATLSVPIKPRKYIRESFQGKNTDYGNPFVFRYQDEFVNHKENLKIFRNIPFLNGGLFECLDEVPRKDNDLKEEIRLDGFSTTKKKQAIVPDFLFWGEHKGIDLSEELDDKQKNNETVCGIIDILNAYKFTVEENTPLEEEIALDPELLGKVFENLLASYNPETKSTARKQSGSFYTPREIVNYMVDESLAAYLKQKLSDAGIKDKEKSIRDIISYSENPNPFNAKETILLINAIDTCKILDPACGSGAFPMGILHKLTHILHTLDPRNELWEQKQLEKALLQDDITIREHLIVDIEAAFKNNELDYGRKLYLIKNCLYGIDIQPIAIQIAKLRFFISLIVDQKVDILKENFGIRSLPNLDFKLICANTLIGAPKECELKKENDLGMEIIDPFFEKFNSLTDKYFSAYLPNEKKNITGEIKKLVNKKVQDKIAEAKRLGTHLGTHSNKQFNKFVANKYKNQIEQKKRNAELWQSYNNLFKHESVGFFETKYFFPKAKDGFDIVIANPPYVRADDPNIKNQRVAIMNSKTFRTLWEKWDLYVAFIEKGYGLLAHNGILEFIIPDAYMSSKYAEKSHEYFLQNATISRINFCSDLKIFEAAVRNIIIEFTKNTNPDYIPLRIRHKDTWDNLIFLPSKKQLEMGENTFKLDSENKIIGDLSNTLIWVEICYVSKGMVLNSDEKQYKNEFQKIDLISETKDEIHSKLYIEAKWIKKYFIEKVKYLEWNTPRVPEKISRPTFPELYVPQKIIKGRMTPAIYDDKGLFCNDSCFVCVLWRDLASLKNRSIKGSIKKDFHINDIQSFRKQLEKNSSLFNLKYLLAILNSKFAYKFLDSVRRSQIGFYPDDLKKLPIKKISLTEQKPFVEIVDKIMAITQSDDYLENPAKKEKVKEYEKQIDQMVYKLYNLTNEEIKIVEQSMKQVEK